MKVYNQEMPFLKTLFACRRATTFEEKFAIAVSHGEFSVMDYVCELENRTSNRNVLVELSVTIPESIAPLLPSMVSWLVLNICLSTAFNGVSPLVCVPLKVVIYLSYSICTRKVVLGMLTSAVLLPGMVT